MRKSQIIHGLIRVISRCRGCEDARVLGMMESHEMGDKELANALIRFGVFEVDPRSGEMRKSGLRIKLQDQPFKVLLALLERPGEVVSREDLKARIWPNDSFGDFDHAVNVAVAKLRTALADPGMWRPCIDGGTGSSFPCSPGTEAVRLPKVRPPLGLSNPI
jgi:DNA-binding response OmpR family regulator